eukprot:TRINITY_DN14964_c0_g1_i2.p2 TRINITY_DN14964_c0_g1~~TRINITY_DN14964_c0_g1_i2.p2  ORF type:complete len:257 (-),score=101.12 TRINITY_DN14964_c0_g1_i2:2-772(-)
MRIRVLALAFVAVLLLGVPARGGVRVPFGPGERLTYAIYWTFVHAGDAVLEVMPDTELDGVPARHFKATAKTVPWVDKFYKVRDSMDAWTDAEVTHFLRYKKDQNEGSYHKSVDLVFDKQANQTRRFVRGELKHTLDQPEDVFDPMSILFKFRKQILYKTMRFGANVTDGKISVVGRAYVEDMEELETPMGVIPTFRVRLDISQLSGVFKKSPDAELLVWFSADSRRLPVRVRSKVVVGHFTMELVGYQLLSLIHI